VLFRSLKQNPKSLPALKLRQAGAIPNGILYLKGGDFEDELKQLETYVRPLSGEKKQGKWSDEYSYKIYNLSDYFDEDFFKTKKVVSMSVS